jgi:predicted alpha/beta superfamily hydrolase
MKRRITFTDNVIICFLLLSTIGYTQTPFEIGKKILIRSVVLNESRELWVYTPTDYDRSSDGYPVLYLLDGESHFRHTAAMVEYLSDNLILPQMIIVAIPNTDRIRDFTPLRSLIGLNGKEDPSLFSTTGGAINLSSL